MSGPFGSTAWMSNQASGFYDFEISNSLRFNDGDSAYLGFTPSSAGNRRTWTWSCWVKLGILGTSKTLFGSGTASSNDNTLDHTDGSIFLFYDRTADKIFLTDAVYRDPSAWYNVVFVADTTNSTAGDRLRLFVNGVRQAGASGSAYPNQNTDLGINNNVTHFIGARKRSAIENFYDGYQADTCFIDGTALAPSSFGETKNDIWIPKNTSGLTFGDQGWRLQFKQVGTGTASSSTIGADTSGEGNHWTSNNLVASDVVPDSPTLNFATYNPLAFDANSTYSEGNLKAVVTSGNASPLSFGMTSGKWYAEVRCSGGTNTRVGVVNEKGVGADLGGSANSWSKINNSARVFHNGAVTSQGAEWDDGQVAMVAIDVDARKIWYGVEGTWDISGDPAAGNNPSQSSITGDTLFLASASGSGTLTYIFNTGSDGTFGGAETSQGNADGNDIGDFYYAPPSGYLALCTANLPDAVETMDPAQGGSPQDYFNTVLYTGNGGDANSPQAITGVGFQPDWVWGKNRDAGKYHYLSDSVRGVSGGSLASNDTIIAEDIGFKAFGSDGFSVSDVDSGTANENNNKYVAWNWKAGTSFSNDASATGVGSIDSAGTVSTDAGFSIINYTGNGTSGATVAHGLNSAPQVTFIKNLITAGKNWESYMINPFDGSYDYFYLNLTAGKGDFAGGTVPSSTVITLGGGADSNENTKSTIAYCFHSVDGYSKFGGFTGNANANGPYVYTGFRPAFIMTKRIDSTANWVIYDSDRTPSNPMAGELYPDLDAAESVPDPARYDFFSNGFRPISTAAGSNASGGKFIYLAFAEQSFKYANAR